MAAKAKTISEPGDTLSQRVIRGGVWVFALRITDRTFQIIRLIIIARILAPRDFGLMGIAILTMAMLDTFSQTGFQQALIQKKSNTDAYLDAAWTVLILRGFLLFAILFFIAPYAAVFFKAPEAKPIIQVIGFSVLLQSFTNIGVIYFQKELEFNKQFLYQLSGTLADFIVAISAALMLRSVWALVFGLLAGNIARFIASYLIHPYRPHLSFDLGKAKELFGFGKWILGSSILVFLIMQGDDIFVGKLLGVVALGFYQIAFSCSFKLTKEIVDIISQVTFPVYSKLQNNLPSLRESYLKTLQVVSSISIPLAGGIFILSPQFTRIFLGEKWLPIVPVMQVFSLYGAIRPLGAITGPLFQGMGKPQISTKLTFTRLVLLAILIYPFTIHWGILGASLAVAISGSVGGLIGCSIAIKNIKCGAWNFWKTSSPPFIATGIMVLFIFILKEFWINLAGMSGIFLFITIGVLSYSGVSYLFCRYSSYDIQTTVKKSLALLGFGNFN